MDNIRLNSTISFTIDKNGLVTSNYQLGENHVHFATLLHSIATGSITDRLLTDLTQWAKSTGKMQDVTTILEIWRGLVNDDTPCIKPSRVLDKVSKECPI